MENQNYAPAHSDPSRPSLGFPLGTALLLLIIFSLSGIFSCCYHWDKLRSLRRSFANSTDLEAGGDPSYLKSKRAYMVRFKISWIGYMNLFNFNLISEFYPKKKESNWAIAEFYGCSVLQNCKQNQISDMPAVLMPGDQVPKFIALPCPCQPPRPDKVLAEVQQQPSSPMKPPPHTPVRAVAEAEAEDVTFTQIRSTFYL